MKKSVSRMDNLISRQAAINLADDLRDYISVEGYWAWIERLKGLPTAQPTQTNTLNALKSLDCIDRQWAIDAVLSVIPNDGYWDEQCEKAIRRLPSAQPERIKGRWIKISPAGIYECSVCGQNVMTDDIDVYYYCHGCGADMREQDDQDRH